MKKTRSKKSRDTVPLKGQCHEIFCVWFFHESVPPPHLRVFRLDCFEFFRKFAEIFASQSAPPVSTTPVATSGKIAAGIKDTGGKFATGISDTGGKFLHHFR